ncbi:beta-glucosidase [Butyrivibrio sp. Su6]|uniref:glycoside hydrolase family 3 N-terminal domain-containing protein n=1 Tax=Butyrivibrio sp. Su6 TaxID=1520810 RepID=UPI00089F47DC|nr:glycoside hydrolase family 3 N-terminal domain-containing protein [Butyrivibrio sp. Su6]SEF58338.1 beta-glucosidase [Butyrivibrio sp. Su6]
MKKKKLIWKILTVITGILMLVFIIGTPIAIHYGTVINWALGVVPYKTIKSDVEENVVYFPSEFVKKDADGSTQLTASGSEVYDDAALVKAGQELCKEVTAEGIALVMNDGLLPIQKGTKVGLFSQSTVNLLTSGTGSGSTASTGEYTFYTSMEHAGLVPNSALWKFYSEGAGKDFKRSGPSITSPADYLINEVNWSILESDSTFDSMIANDVAIFNVSRVAGEGYDIPSGLDNALTQSDLGAITATESGMDGNGLKLNDDEKSVLEGLKNLKAEGKLKGIIVTINAANMPQVDFLTQDYGVDAVLVISTTGECGIDSLGAVLTGDINPSGHLVDTICYDNTKNPAMMNFGEHQYANYRKDYLEKVKSSSIPEAFMNQMNYQVYQEGIYIGYRYYETRYEDYVMQTGNPGQYAYNDIVAFPFGYGLSYTDFEYSDYEVTEDENNVTVNVNVTNVGSVAGKEVVEVYFQSPYTDYDKENGVEKASVELCGYDKTESLEPGQSEKVTITISKEELAAYDSNNAKTYILDAGEYYFTLANGTHEAVNNILAAKGFSPETTDQRMDAEGNADLVKTITVADLDKEKFAHSAVTGADITNQFDDVDINKYDESQKITYLTRNDWVATYPHESVVLNMTDKMFEEVQSDYFPEIEEVNSDEYKMPVFGANYGLKLITLKGEAYDNPMWDKLLDQMTYEEMKALLIRGGHTTAAVNSISKPATSDQNGPTGFGTTFVGGGKGTSYPSASMRAQTYNDELVKRVGELIGEDGLHSHISGIYGFGINTHRTPYSGRNYEYYSEDPFIAGSIGTNECIGIQSKGIIVYEKHCFLNDQETHREGVGTWSNEQAIREIYLNAFSKVLRADMGNAKAIMTGFNRLGTTWNGMHSYINNVVRGEFGFDGFTITDADSDNEGIICVSYMYAPRAVSTGTDMYDGLYDNHGRTSQLDEYKDNAYVMSNLREACHRICYAVVNSSAMNGISSNDIVVAVLPWWQKALYALIAVFVVLFALCIFMLVRKPKEVEESAEKLKKNSNAKRVAIIVAVIAVVAVAAFAVSKLESGGNVKDFEVQENGDFSFTSSDNSYVIKVYNDSDVSNGTVADGAVVLGSQSANGGVGNINCVPFGENYAVVLYELDANYNEKQVAVLNGYKKCGVLTAPKATYQPGIPYIHTVDRIEIDLKDALASEALTSYQVETYLDEALTQKVESGCGVVEPTVEEGRIINNYLEFTPEIGNTYYFRIKALANEDIGAEESDWGEVTSFTAME